MSANPPANNQTPATATPFDAQTMPGPVTAPVTRTPYRVLIVDDDPMIRSLVNAILKRAGYETETAADGDIALERVSQQDFDLIFTDIRMPRLSGPELYRRLQEIRPELARRVIFATSDALTAELREFFSAAGQPYLRKPFSTDDVRRLAAELCAA